MLRLSVKAAKNRNHQDHQPQTAKKLQKKKKRPLINRQDAEITKKDIFIKRIWI